MAEEAQDELVFTMVNGDVFRMYVPAGTGQQELGSVDSDLGWLTIDDETRIQTDKIVSVVVKTHDSGPPSIS